MNTAFLPGQSSERKQTLNLMEGNMSQSQTESIYKTTLIYNFQEHHGYDLRKKFSVLV